MPGCYLTGNNFTQFGANEALSGLKDALSLPVLPSLIEAFDISNISGTNATGSLVSFENGSRIKRITAGSG